VNKRLLRSGLALGVVGVLAIVFVTLGLSSKPTLDTNYRPLKAPQIQRANGNLNSAVASSKKLSLQSSAVSVPVELVIPSIAVKSPLLAVGMTTADAMSAPEGGAGSPDWSDTFWYRGSAVPGAVGTATIAGHIDDAYGDYAVFGRLSSLVPGDSIFVRNTKTGASVHFVVTKLHAYTLAQATTLPVLDLIYGTGPPKGEPPQPSADGLAHLSLVTCAGTWIPSLHTHNERLVVSAVRVA
jgi:sortase (surface protein transpeptidase)